MFQMFSQDIEKKFGNLQQQKTEKICAAGDV